MYSSANLVTLSVYEICTEYELHENSILLQFYIGCLEVTQSTENFHIYTQKSKFEWTLSLLQYYWLGINYSVVYN